MPKLKNVPRIASRYAKAKKKRQREERAARAAAGDESAVRAQHKSRKIKRSALLAITRSHLDIAKERRGPRGIKIKSLKMVHQLFYRKVDGKGQVGTRNFRCVCNKCFERKFSECVAKKWTGGEPTWLNCD